MKDHIVHKISYLRNSQLAVFLVSLFLFVSLYFYCAQNISTNSTVYGLGITLSLTMMAIAYNVFFWYEGRRYRLVEIELDLVRDSIDKFYSPFFDMLNHYDTYVSDGTFESKLYALLCYRHLAEPEMNKKFGEYVENRFDLPEVRYDLSLLISKDIVDLQSRFKLLKEKVA